MTGNVDRASGSMCIAPWSSRLFRTPSTEDRCSRSTPDVAYLIHLAVEGKQAPALGLTAGHDLAPHGRPMDGSSMKAPRWGILPRSLDLLFGMARVDAIFGGEPCLGRSVTFGPGGAHCWLGPPNP